jgi:ESS family glutamate:Na+ symporter
MVAVIKVNAPEVLGLAAVGVLLGTWLKRRIPLLDRLNIPVSIAGGMVYALAAMALRDRVANFEFDTVLRDLLMVAFMTTVGLSARVQLVREGGVKVIWLLAIATLGALLQNALGMGVARAMGVDARLGILAGAVSLTGGPATALAFGPTFERMGVAGATTVAFASATFGIAIAGLIGGFIGGQLIRRHGLKAGAGSAARHAARHKEEGAAAPRNLLASVLVMGIAMGLGALLSAGIERLGVILPSYIGAMIVAAILRNLDDRYGFARVSQRDVTEMGRVSLYLFIVMALLTLRLWELVHLALPMLVILAAQVALVWGMCLTICFWAMGRDHEAAVTSAGFCGFMLGITSNAVASMEELVEKYGPAPRAFLVVPIVGAFLIDFTNSLIITTMANLVR